MLFEEENRGSGDGREGGVKQQKRSISRAPLGDLNLRALFVLFCAFAA